MARKKTLVGQLNTRQVGAITGQAKPPAGFAAAFGAAPAPAAPTAPSVFAPDAQYLAEAGQRLQDRQAKTNELNANTQTDSQDTAEAIRRLLQSRGEVETSTKQTANKQGLFYSGQLGKRLGDVAADFTRRQSDAQLALDRREAAREAARRAIESGAPLSEAAALAQAADRQIARDQTAADANALVRNPSPAAAPKATTQPQAPAKRKKKAVQMGQITGRL